MNTKNLVLMALLVGIGTVLYVVVPGYGGGMKPDFMVLMMCLGIILFPTVKETFVLSITTGVISGLLSTFPGGFVPNVIDKLVTAFVFLLVVLALKSLVNNVFTGAVIVGLGTIVSGTVFLTSALLIANLPADAFGPLFVTVVLVTGGLNAIAFFIVYPIITSILKRSKFNTAVTPA